MASKKEELRSRLRLHLARESPAVIDEALAGEIRESLAPVSAKMLRDLLRESGVPLAPMVEGVRQDDLAGLERTLLGLAVEYREGDEARRRQVRQLVITAKDHARWAMRAESDEKLEARQEMVLWMMTWLENPQVFELWVPLRKRVLEHESTTADR